MNYMEVISSWDWRIVRAFKTHKEGAKVMGISPQTLSGYMHNHRVPSVARYEQIEGAIREREIQLGYIRDIG